MAKIKHTKNELKAQRDALNRYQRFLPMLQLKKQQLQAEIHAVNAHIAAKRADEERLRAGVARWVGLFAEDAGVGDAAALERVVRDEGNIAGVSIPILREVTFQRADYDLFLTPPWLDDAVDTLTGLARLRLERATLEEQRRRIVEELRVTAQRVNLFEKVKIPECRENIRVIRIFLGDEQAAGVARAKIAKRRAVTTEPAAPADGAAA
jgi:V/A-type H+/Na+-transporting ATPase subunit D